MLYIYRPTVNIARTVDLLSAQHCALMKVNTATLVETILQKKGWIDGDDLVELYENDLFFKYYYNNGKPILSPLLEYYTESYIKWMTYCGEIVDIIGRFEQIAEAYIDECADDTWGAEMATTHALWLLKHDYEFYKRKFRDLYCYDNSRITLFSRGKPKKTNLDKLKNVRKKLSIDDLLKL